MNSRTVFKESRYRWLLRGTLLASLAVFFCFLAGWGVEEMVLSRNLGALRARTAQRLEFLCLSLESTLDRNESLPKLIALDEKLSGLLLQPGSPERRRSANTYLADVRRSAGIAAAYLMNDAGLTLASSNAGEPGSFVGKNYSFRPYFRDAMQGRLGRFYGIGTTTGEPGYFLASPIEKNGRRIGAVAVKVSLDGFETALFRGGDSFLLLDSSGVIFLSSLKQWKYRTVTQLDRETKLQLIDSRQYHNRLLRPLEATLRLKDGSAGAMVALPDRSRYPYLPQSRKIGSLGWNMVLLAGSKEEQQGALWAGVAAGFAAAFVLSLATYFHLYTVRFRERRQAEAALRQAHQELEQRIADRTGDLVAANRSLEEKVSDLRGVERILRETRDKAVQAGKLAVLGQMSAGISHEINQPLTALHTYADNAVSLLDRGRLPEVRENLGLIGGMADRMAKIIGEVKNFALKPMGERQKVRVLDTVRHAATMVETRRRQVGARIEMPESPADLLVMAGPVRFEQVLVNLLKNGLDAVADAPEKVVSVSFERGEGRVCIRVADSGPGIPEAVLTELFEPFFTTKAAGEGLGLGLAISRMIVTEFGGSIEARNREGGGAEFSVVLEEA